MVIALVVLFFVPVFALCLRFAARVLRKAHIEWKASFLVGAAAMAIGGAFAGVQSLFVGSISLGLFGLASFLAQLVGSGWLIGVKAINADGSLVQFPKGVLVFIVAYAMLLVAFMVGGLVVVVASLAFKP